MKSTLACSTLVLSMATFALSCSSPVTAENLQAPTIRTLSGEISTTALTASSTALIVIDFQNEYFEGKIFIPDGMKALKNTQRLVKFAHKNQFPVFFIQHIGLADGPLFAKGSKTAKFHPDLQPGKTDHVITKATPSSFVGTDLEKQLKQMGIKKIIITGLMTHMCVSSTARDAVPLGYQVIIAEDATATRDLATWDHQVIDHDTLQKTALAGVADVFAEIFTTDQILKLPVK